MGDQLHRSAKTSLARRPSIYAVWPSAGSPSLRDEDRGDGLTRNIRAPRSIGKRHDMHDERFTVGAHTRDGDATAAKYDIAFGGGEDRSVESTCTTSPPTWIRPNRSAFVYDRRE